MAAVVEVDAGQAAKKTKATVEGKPQPQPPVAAAGKQRRPTPDHPPYCWMIGEAIDALGVDGGSVEKEPISAFIRATHPGVPAAHDMLLRHYLAKHVSEGFFVCLAPGRYARLTDESTAVELPVERAAGASTGPVHVGSPVTEAKRGRGRPRKDGSSSASPVGEKDGNAGARSKTPKHRGRRRNAAQLAADEGSVPKDGSEAPSATDKEHERASELALVIVSDGFATVPEDSGQDCELALVAADAGSSPVLVSDKKDGDEASSSTFKRLRQTRKAAPAAITTRGSARTSSAGQKAPSATPKGSRRLRKPVATGDRSATTPVAGKINKAGGEVSSATPNLTPVTACGGATPAVASKPPGQPHKLYPLTADEIPDLACFLLALPAHILPAANS